MFENLAQNFKNKFVFAQLDISKVPQIAQQLGASSASTLIVLKNGVVTSIKQTFDGKQIEDFINQITR
jgi:thioredoxin-like negative regulator of GroEL